MRHFASFIVAIRTIMHEFKDDCYLVPATFWQSVDVSGKPDMATYEAMNVSFGVSAADYDTRRLVKEINPSMPWAEDHFKERVYGDPFNPGETWRKWPFALKADSFRDAAGQFNHNYMERYWPRYANSTPDGVLPPHVENLPCNFGIRAPFGDLWDVMDLFQRDPLTRQAYVPIFFPEDTGAAHLGRVPCTLGYHFIRRNDRLHVNYYIRSCDIVRHFRDDIYLTVRLLQWMLEHLKTRDPMNWADVLPGEFNMFITSLHMFRNDWCTVYNEAPPNFIGGINEYSRSYRRGPSSVGATGGAVSDSPTVILYPTAGGGGGVSPAVSVGGQCPGVSGSGSGVGEHSQNNAGSSSSGPDAGPTQAEGSHTNEGATGSGSSGNLDQAGGNGGRNSSD